VDKFKYSAINIDNILGRFHPFLYATKSLRDSRGIAVLFLDLGTRRGRGVSVTPRPLSTSGKDPVPIV
jgi:hypothetical protein